MVLLPSFLLILACLSGSFGEKGEKDRQKKKVFVFAERSNTGAVVPNVPLEQPLSALTVSLRHYTHHSNSHGQALFSYATRSSDNDFLIYKASSNQYSIYVGGSRVTFTVAEQKEPKWVHIVVSWKSETGVLSLWVNGEPLPRKIVRKGYSISHNASIVLGQDQDSFGGGFDSRQSFVGELSDVIIWVRALIADEIIQIPKNENVPGQVFNSGSSKYEIKGNVLVEDFLPQISLPCKNVCTKD